MRATVQEVLMRAPKRYELQNSEAAAWQTSVDME
jgi:hypothetical protein